MHVRSYYPETAFWVIFCHIIVHWKGALVKRKSKSLMKFYIGEVVFLLLKDLKSIASEKIRKSCVFLLRGVFNAHFRCN